MIFVNRNGLRWCDAPQEYDPPETLYNRWKRWSDKGVFARMMDGLATDAAVHVPPYTWLIVGDGNFASSAPRRTECACDSTSACHPHNGGALPKIAAALYRRFTRRNRKSDRRKKDNLHAARQLGGSAASSSPSFGRFRVCASSSSLPSFVWRKRPGGAQWVELVHPDDVDLLNKQEAEAFAAGHWQIETEIRLRHREGHWVWVLTRTEATKWDATGKPVKTSGVKLDISAAKGMEAALARERDTLALIMETSVSGILAVEGTGRVVFANAGVERVIGRPVYVLGCSGNGHHGGCRLDFWRVSLAQTSRVVP
jgi:PAS domain-containing protein/transposase